MSRRAGGRRRARPGPETGYADVLRHLFGLRRMGVRLELERMRAALTAVGNPQRDLRFVHVAGTNGKGSTAAFIEAMLRAAGHRTGLFTSPHLSRFTERVRVAGEEIAREDVVRLYDRVRTRVRVPLTFFETVTLIALMCFREREVDVAVLETGLGGRFDATNVVTPEVAVVTGVALDHTEYLGATLAAIAEEKAGILKPGRPAVVGVPVGDALAVVERTAEEQGAPLWLQGRDFALERDSAGFRFRAAGAPPLAVPRLALSGPHQEHNAALALMAARLLEECGLRVPEEAKLRGLETCAWPGRLEELSARPRMLVDAAHNPDGALALARALTELRYGRLVLCIGVLEDKDAAGILAPLLPMADRVIAVRPRSARALRAEALAALAPGAEVGPDLAGALERVCGILGEDGLCVIAGSLFLVGEARELLVGEEADPISVGDPLGVAASGAGAQDTTDGGRLTTREV
jgi:dihydrofolate synthase / folylpolyglutamate synthase